MSVLIWDQIEDRRFEAGIDRGVFYPTLESDGGYTDGVVWNGLIAVEETTTGGEAESFYFDGDKYLVAVGRKFYQSSVESFSPPEGFGPCNGLRDIVPGFIITRQPRAQFGFSYRHQVSNTSHKIHLVYNVVATQLNQNRQTKSGSVSVEEKQWTFDAIPVEVPGYASTAHFVIDLSKISKFKANQLETIIYGSVGVTPHLPSIEELIDIIGASEIIDGGSPSYTTPDILDGGTYVTSQPGLVDAGGVSDE